LRFPTHPSRTLLPCRDTLKVCFTGKGFPLAVRTVGVVDVISHNPIHLSAHSGCASLVATGACGGAGDCSGSVLNAGGITMVGGCTGGTDRDGSNTGGQSSGADGGALETGG